MLHCLVQKTRLWSQTLLCAEPGSRLPEDSMAAFDPADNKQFFGRGNELRKPGAQI